MTQQKTVLPHNRDESRVRQIAALRRRIAVLEHNPFIRSTSDVSIHGAEMNGGDFAANVNSSEINAGLPGHTVTATTNENYQSSGGGGGTVSSLSRKLASTGAGITHAVNSTKGPSSLLNQLATKFSLSWPGAAQSGGGGVISNLSNPEDESASPGAGITHSVSSPKGPSTEMTQHAGGMGFEWPGSSQGPPPPPPVEALNWDDGFTSNNFGSRYTVMSGSDYAVKQESDPGGFGIDALCRTDSVYDASSGWYDTNGFSVEWKDPNGPLIDFEPDSPGYLGYSPYEVSVDLQVGVVDLTIGWIDEAGGLLWSMVFSINDQTFAWQVTSTITLNGNTIGQFTTQITTETAKLTSVSLDLSADGWAAKGLSYVGSDNALGSGSVDFSSLVGAVPYSKIVSQGPTMTDWGWMGYVQNEGVDRLTEPLETTEHTPYTMTMDANGVEIDAPVDITGSLTVNGTEISGGSGTPMAAGQNSFVGAGSATIVIQQQRTDWSSTDTSKLVCSPAVGFLDANSAWSGEIHTEDPANGGATFPMRATRTDGVFANGTTYYFNYVGPVQ